MKLHQRVVLLECRRAENRLPFFIDHDRRAVEEQLVVAAHLVHIHERNVVARGDAREKIVTRAPLAAVERRRGNVQDDLRPLPRQLVDRIAAVDFRAEDFVVEPEILADGDACFDAGDVDDTNAASRLEVAQLVEDVVSRQQRLVLLMHDPAVLCDERRVVQRFPAPALVFRDAAEDERDLAGYGGERVTNLERRCHENVAVEQIARRIARHGQFRDHHDLGAAANAFFIRSPDQLGVRAQRADGGIDLADENPHVNFR